eukprot:4896234-Prymnesium_polylepis.1
MRSAAARVGPLTEGVDHVAEREEARVDLLALFERGAGRAGAADALGAGEVDHREARRRHHVRLRRVLERLGQP